MQDSEFEYLADKLVEFRDHKESSGDTEYTIDEFYQFAGVHENDIGEHGYYNKFTFGALKLRAFSGVKQNA